MVNMLVNMLVKKQTLKKIPQLRAIDILKRYQQDKSLRSLVDTETTPVDLLNALERKKRFYELVTFICHSLQSMESIWWGYLCVCQVKNDLPDIQQKTLDVVKCWLHEPVEAHRRLAEVAVKRVELDNACGWLAQAVFWSGGSITPVNAPESPAPPYLYSHAVAGAICLAAVLPDGRYGEKRYRQFIESGIKIADGGDGR